MRRNSEWRSNFYNIFEKIKKNKDTVTFENILCNIYVYTNQTEASFASKMLATLNPNKPIWDSSVLSFLGLKPTGKTDSCKQDSSIEIYSQIEAWYAEYLKTEESRDNISIFDKTLPLYAWISDVKKIDYMLWIAG